MGDKHASLTFYLLCENLLGVCGCCHGDVVGFVFNAVIFSEPSQSFDTQLFVRGLAQQMDLDHPVSILVGSGLGSCGPKVTVGYLKILFLQLPYLVTSSVPVISPSSLCLSPLLSASSPFPPLLVQVLDPIPASLLSSAS